METRIVKRAYKFRFYPDAEQESLMNRTFGCVRLVYNKALEARSKAYSEEKKSVSYGDTSKLLTSWKKSEELSFLNEVSCVPLQQSLRHLATAYGNFFTKKAKYPKFKSRKNKLSAEFTRSAFSWNSEKRHLKLAKTSKPLKIKWSRELPDGAFPSTVTISKDTAGRWFISMLVDCPVAVFPKSEKITAIDLGVKNLITTSEGETINLPDFSNLEKQRRHLQKKFSRSQKGSKNREKARLRLARLSARISDSRQNALHQITTKLIRENQAIIIEDLNVKGMTASGGSFKRGLNRALSNASFGEFRRMLEYKADWYGREIVVNDRFFPSSKTCNNCGSVKEKMALSERHYLCEHCGHQDDRDINAAKNLMVAGLAMSAYGGDVRPLTILADGGADAEEVGTTQGASALGIPVL